MSNLPISAGCLPRELSADDSTVIGDKEYEEAANMCSSFFYVETINIYFYLVPRKKRNVQLRSIVYS